ncbi:MAG: hypothetical protein MUC96_22060 [Myxococcaceae bacterium]|jgi:hypothetical protein|nr:hypothetical protein [Myxococcaceae bacterium]
MKALRLCALAVLAVTACDFDALYDERCRALGCDQLTGGGSAGGAMAGGSAGGAAGGGSAGGAMGGGSAGGATGGGSAPLPQLSVRVTANDGGPLRDGGLRSDGGALLLAATSECVRGEVVAGATLDGGLVTLAAVSGPRQLQLYAGEDCTAPLQGRSSATAPFFVAAMVGDAGAFGRVEVTATAAGFDSRPTVVQFVPPSLQLTGGFQMGPGESSSVPLDFREGPAAGPLVSLDTVAVSCPPVSECGVSGPTPNPAVFDAGAKTVMLTVTAGQQLCLGTTMVQCSIDLGGPLVASAPVRVCYRAGTVLVDAGIPVPCCAGFTVLDAGVRCD